MEEGIDFILKSFDIKRKNAGEFSPLVLAYVGDAVYELIIRAVLVSQGNRQVNKIHMKATSLVKASAQAAIVRIIRAEFSPEEESIFRRGRNASTHTMAKNASMSDYKFATGFEGLIGFLYLDGRFDRALQLVRTGVEKFSEG